MVTGPGPEMSPAELAARLHHAAAVERALLARHAYEARIEALAASAKAQTAERLQRARQASQRLLSGPAQPTPPAVEQRKMPEALDGFDPAEYPWLYGLSDGGS